MTTDWTRKEIKKVKLPDTFDNIYRIFARSYFLQVSQLSTQDKREKKDRTKQIIHFHFTHQWPFIHAKMEEMYTLHTHHKACITIWIFIQNKKQHQNPLQVLCHNEKRSTEEHTIFEWQEPANIHTVRHANIQRFYKGIRQLRLSKVLDVWS